MIYGYLRVSTVAQGESGRGLAGQRDLILARYPGRAAVSCRYPSSRSYSER